MAKNRTKNRSSSIYSVLCFMYLSTKTWIVTDSTGLYEIFKWATFDETS